MTIKKPTIGLLLGDATGIGPELIAKALQDETVRNLANWLIIGDERVLKQGEAIAKAYVKYDVISTPEEIVESDNKLWLMDLKNIDPESYKVGVLSETAGKAMGDTLKYAIDLAQKNMIDSIAYAPLNKEALQRGGYIYKDELHFFAELFDWDKDYCEVNFMNELWVTRITSHIPFRNICSSITKENVLKRIKFSHNIVSQSGVKNPQIVVAALNPHGGEGGLAGDEEINEIIPAIQEARKMGFNVDGPFPADTIFLRMDDEPFDCLLSMYHDQGQTGMKLLGFHRGVTICGGFPTLIVTPAHGTAFDIAGKGEADPGAMITSMKLVVRLTNINGV